MSRIVFLLVTLVALTLSIPAALQAPRSLYPAELDALDDKFGQRKPLPFSKSPRVVIIGIDAETYNQMAKPLVFWNADIGRVVQGLLDGGGRAVGLDILLGDVGTEGGLQDPVYAPVREIMQNEETGLIVALTSGKVVLGQFNIPGTRIVIPDPSPGANSRLRNALASTAAAMGSLCLVNMDADEDGVLRTTEYRKLTDSEIEGSPLFAFRLLEIATGKLFKLENGQLWLGDELIPTEPGSDGAPHIRLNFPGPPDAKTRTSFEYVSFGKLLKEAEPGRPLEGFKDTICILCFSDPSMLDFRPTPFNKLNNFDSLGAETHATLINQVLTGRYVRATGWPVWVGVTLGVSLLVAWVAYKMRWYFSLPLTILLIRAYAWETDAMFAQGLWLPIIVPLTSAVIAFLTAYVGRYDLVKRLFGSMVGAQVSEHMLKRGALKMLPGEARRVTVLFSDINDFTPMTERNTPADVILMLNDYFGEMCAIVEKHQGYIKQFVGDEIMVIFNAPENQHDHAARAVRCGMDMIDRLHELKQKSGGKDGFYEVKIGINTGDCVAGNVGTESRMEYAAVGDDVNLGARIESLTKKLGAFMLVSATTKQECEAQLPEVEWISRGVQQFKGKSAEMEVFEVRRKSSEDKGSK